MSASQFCEDFSAIYLNKSNNEVCEYKYAVNKDILDEWYVKSRLEDLRKQCGDFSSRLNKNAPQKQDFCSIAHDDFNCIIDLSSEQFSIEWDKNVQNVFQNVLKEFQNEQNIFNNLWMRINNCKFEKTNDGFRYSIGVPGANIFLFEYNQKYKLFKTSAVIYQLDYEWTIGDIKFFSEIINKLTEKFALKYENPIFLSYISGIFGANIHPEKYYTIPGAWKPSANSDTDFIIYRSNYPDQTLKLLLNNIEHIKTR